MKTTFCFLQLFIFLFWSLNEIEAQNIGINGSGANAHSSALLDVDATSTPSLGILIPRIALQAINLAVPVTSPATSLLVYNTAAASTGTNAVSAGYYYWDGTKWVRFAYSPSGSSANDWNILGNAGTVAGTNFIGTTDNVNLIFKRNSINSGLVSPLNTSFGYNSGGFVALSAANSAFGAEALMTVSGFGNSNAAFGYKALSLTSSGQDNSAFGSNSAQNNTTGRANSSFGMGSLTGNTTGTENVALGWGSGITVATGLGNTLVGARADVAAGTYTNATAIGYNSRVGQSNALILGGTGANAVNVGIGTTTPTEMFTIENGNMQLGESMPVTGLGRQLFFSDVPNNAFDPIYFQRQNISSDFSNLNLSIGDNHNVGYSNDKFNVGAGYSSGVFNSVLTVEMGNARVGINTSNPTEKLEVQGSVKIVDGTQGAGKILVSDANGKGSWASTTGTTTVINSTTGNVTPVGAAMAYTGANAVVTVAGYYLISFRLLVDKSPLGCGSYIAFNLGTSSSSPTGLVIPFQDIHTASGSQTIDAGYTSTVAFFNPGTYYMWIRSAGTCTTQNLRGTPAENSFTLTQLK